MAPPVETACQIYIGKFTNDPDEEQGAAVTIHVAALAIPLKRVIIGSFHRTMTTSLFVHTDRCCMRLR